jgi:hypothetical protein
MNESLLQIYVGSTTIDLSYTNTLFVSNSTTEIYNKAGTQMKTNGGAHKFCNTYRLPESLTTNNETIRIVWHTTNVQNNNFELIWDTVGE